MGCDCVMGLVRSHSVTFCHNIPHIMRQCHHVPRLCDSMRQQYHHPCRHMLAPIPRRTYTMNDTLTDIMGCAMLTVLFVALVALWWDYCYKSFSLYIENLNQNVVRNACHILSQSLKQLREQYKYIYYRENHHALSPQSHTRTGSRTHWRQVYTQSTGRPITGCTVHPCVRRTVWWYPCRVCSVACKRKVRD